MLNSIEIYFKLMQEKCIETQIFFLIKKYDFAQQKPNVR